MSALVLTSDIGYHALLVAYASMVLTSGMCYQIQPKEVKWQLMVASCHRRVGSYTQVSSLAYAPTPAVPQADAVLASSYAVLT